MEHYKLFIDGEFVEAASGDVFETIDPGTGVSFAWCHKHSFLPMTCSMFNITFSTK